MVESIKIHMSSHYNLHKYYNTLVVVVGKKIKPIKKPKEYSLLSTKI